MNLSDAIVGIPVTINSNTQAGYVLGHITGFARNPTEEVILTVKDDRGMNYSTHPSNVEPLAYTEKAHYDNDNQLTRVVLGN